MLLYGWLVFILFVQSIALTPPSPSLYFFSEKDIGYLPYIAIFKINIRRPTYRLWGFSLPPYYKNVLTFLYHFSFTNNITLYPYIPIITIVFHILYLYTPLLL